jgi:hypothetical protein
MTISLAGFAQNSLINIYSTLTTFSTCDNWLYSGDSIFRTAVLQPLMANLGDSSTTFSKFNLMNQRVMFL